MEQRARGAAEIAAIIAAESDKLVEFIGREFYGSGTDAKPTRDSAVSMVLAQHLIVRTWAERLSEAMSEINHQGEVLVTGPVLERCT